MIRPRMAVLRTATLTLLASLIGCSEGRRAITDPEELATAFAANVSDPTQASSSTAAAPFGSAQPSRSRAETEVVYVSLAPQAIPEGVRIVVRNPLKGFARTEPLVDGGLDPVPVPAGVGDQLELVATLTAGGTLSSAVKVAARRKPRVVRTVPPRGKTDVPLNARIVVVFSEPIDSRTITAASVRLVRGTTIVPAQLEFTGADHVVLTLVPEQPLQATSTYTLVLSDAVRDLDGDPLEETVTVEFVTGSATSGSIRVTTITTGSQQDPDGYAIMGDFLAGQVNPHIGQNSTVTVSDVPTGQRFVWLLDVSENCAVKGQPQVPVTVARGATSSVLFEIECGVTAAMRIRSTTSGVDLDTDGYAAHIRRTGFNRELHVPLNGSATSADLVFGEYLVYLSSVSANCDVSGPNPQVVSLVGGRMTDVDFSITCAPATMIAYSGSPFGIPDSHPENAEIYVVKSNGTGRTRLTAHPAADVEPEWSPDGGRIAWRSDRDGNAEIYVMNANGSAQSRLTSHPAADYEPAWSPDGSKIAFVSERDGNPEIYVMQADGSNPVRLTNNNGADVSPAWSPDGSKIAFRSEQLLFGSGNGEIVVMNADGSGATRLTNDGADDAGPAWSPNGARIAFSRFIVCEDQFGDETILCEYDIFVMNADGSAVTRVGGTKRPFPWSSSSDDEKNPAWSPDGRKIAIGATTCVSDGHCHLSSGVIVITLGAVGYVDLTAGHRFPIAPAWRR